eukprot:TRINITY_DN32222_c0_g1_i1.p1 TRINITY_DN32222_c0_g1~~TRINITY_DN32222_c0_g1_i1.p1  ORF type:complete len:1251 (+),score=256.55 TRINITY_DN32222_c0_g1_i1:74-3754(+)
MRSPGAKRVRSRSRSRTPQDVPRAASAGAASSQPAPPAKRPRGSQPKRKGFRLSGVDISPDVMGIILTLVPPVDLHALVCRGLPPSFEWWLWGREDWRLRLMADAADAELGAARIQLPGGMAQNATLCTPIQQGSSALTLGVPDFYLHESGVLQWMTGWTLQGITSADACTARRPTREEVREFCSDKSEVCMVLRRTDPSARGIAEARGAAVFPRSVHEALAGSPVHTQLVEALTDIAGSDDRLRQLAKGPGVPGCIEVWRAGLCSPDRMERATQLFKVLLKALCAAGCCSSVCDVYCAVMSSGQPTVGTAGAADDKGCRMALQAALSLAHYVSLQLARAGLQHCALRGWTEHWLSLFAARIAHHRPLRPFAAPQHVRLTPQQQEVVAAARALRAREVLPVTALAGTGKTTTTREVCRACAGDGRNVLVLYYNRAAQIAANTAWRADDTTGLRRWMTGGDPRVQVRTMHSLAYHAVREEMTRRKVAKEDIQRKIAEMCPLDPEMFRRYAGLHQHSFMLPRWWKNIFERFVASTDAAPTAYHMASRHRQILYLIDWKIRTKCATGEDLLKLIEEAEKMPSTQPLAHTTSSPAGQPGLHRLGPAFYASLDAYIRVTRDENEGEPKERKGSGAAEMRDNPLVRAVLHIVQKVWDSMRDSKSTQTMTADGWLRYWWERGGRMPLFCDTTPPRFAADTLQVDWWPGASTVEGSVLAGNVRGWYPSVEGGYGFIDGDSGKRFFCGHESIRSAAPPGTRHSLLPGHRVFFVVNLSKTPSNGRCPHTQSVWGHGVVQHRQLPPPPGAVGAPPPLVVVDEAQDQNAVALSILVSSGCPLMLVGDSNQRIYEWRSAVDAMDPGLSIDMPPGAGCSPSSYLPPLPLTTSFRFGISMALVANAMLGGAMGQPQRAQVAPHRRCNICPGCDGEVLFGGMCTALGAVKAVLDDPAVLKRKQLAELAQLTDPQGVPQSKFVYLCRSNATVFEVAAMLAAVKCPICINGQSEAKQRPEWPRLDTLRDYAHLANAAKDPDWKKKITKETFLLDFSSIDEVEEFAGKVDARDIKENCTIARLYKDRIMSMTSSVQDCLVSRRDAKVEISTLHKFKGMEHCTVVVHDDFCSDGRGGYTPLLSPSPNQVEELRVLYVALTRARCRLLISPPLAHALSQLTHTCCGGPLWKEQQGQLRVANDRKCTSCGVGLGPTEHLAQPAQRGDAQLWRVVCSICSARDTMVPNC